MNERNIIGVVCNAGEEPWVREFFELFKTPWEFHRSGRIYSVVLSTSPDVKEVQAKLLIWYFPDHDREPTDQQDVYLTYQDIALPIYGREHAGARTAVMEVAETDNMKVVRVGYNLFDEVRILLTAGQPAHNALTPTLEIHISMLRGWIVSNGIPLVEIPPKPAGYDFVTCLTHDVDFIRIRDHKFDHTILGFMYRASIGSLLKLVQRRMSWRGCLSNLKAFVSLPAIHLGLCKDFWLEDFGRFTSLERDFKATYFFIPFKNQPGTMVARRHAKRRSAVYDVREERGLIQDLARMGNEIGVHGIDAWHDIDKGREERSRVLETAGTPVAGTRMHWLCFDTLSPRLLDQAGFQYDSTFGYNETVGYKGGTTQIFKPDGADSLLELPLHIQDTALFYTGYLELRESCAWKVCETVIRNAAAYGGVITILWHTRSLAPERQWGNFYRRLLEALRARSVWFATAAQVVQWFRYRRAVSFEKVEFSNGSLRLLVRQEGSVGDSRNQPKLVIRIHSKRSFVDIPWMGEPVINVSV